MGLHFISESLSYAFWSFDFQGETISFIIYYMLYIYYILYIIFHLTDEKKYGWASENHPFPSTSHIISYFSPVWLLLCISRQQSYARLLYPLQTFWDPLLLWDFLKHIVKFSMILGKTEVNLQFFSNFFGTGIMRKGDICSYLSICNCLIWKPGNRYFWLRICIICDFIYFM